MSGTQVITTSLNNSNCNNNNDDDNDGDENNNINNNNENNGAFLLLPSAGDMDRLAGEGAGVGRPDPAGEAPATEAVTAVLLLLLLVVLVLLLILFDEVVVVELGTVATGLPLFRLVSEFSAALLFS